jgi:hypothetical protein
MDLAAFAIAFMASCRWTTLPGAAFWAVAKEIAVAKMAIESPEVASFVALAFNAMLHSIFAEAVPPAFDHLVRLKPNLLGMKTSLGLIRINATLATARYYAWVRR